MMLRVKHVILICFCFVAAHSSAQVGVNIMYPDTSAILHLESTTRGFLPPRMTTSQRDAIVQPKPGLTVYNVQDSMMQYYNGLCWLNTWMKNCDDCGFTFSISNPIDTIDRIFTNTAQTILTVNQVAGNPQNISFFVLPGLPQGMTATMDNYTVLGQGSATLTVYADIFTQPGTYSIIVQAVCNGTVSSQVFTIVISPCIEVDIITNQNNYDLQVAAGLPTNVPICVITHIYPGIELTNNLSAPAFTSGNLHPQSQLGIINQGMIMARGGDGAFGGNFSNFGNPGGDGTHAISLTIPATIQNTGVIYGGGGGGGSVGVGITIPVVNINLGIGAGGGGGAAGGVGGTQSLPIPTWADGQAGGVGQNAQGGAGGLLQVPIPLPLGPVTVTINPNVQGGNGGNYGIDGISGSLFVNVVAQVQIPFIGNVTILNTNLPNPPISNFPAGGQAGFAVKRNGNTVTGIIDGVYNTLNVKGEVGN